MKYAIILWYCSVTAPMCSPEDDPTGPAARPPDLLSMIDCEFGVAMATAYGSQPPGTVTRHLCKPVGDDL